MAVQFMRTGQQGVLLWDTETGFKVGIDLFLTDRETRLLQNVVSMDDLGDVACLLGTHDHADHIDREAWKQIAQKYPDMGFVVPAYFERHMPDELEISRDRFLYMNDGMSMEIGPLKIEAVPAAHEFLNRRWDGCYPYLMYILTISGIRICHMGDTCLYEGIYKKLRDKGRFDVLFAPINGRDAVRYSRGCIGNMTYQEAADLTGTLRPRLVVPGHYDMFADNSEDPELFRAYVEAKYPWQQVRILAPGEVYEVPVPEQKQGGRSLMDLFRKTE